MVGEGGKGKGEGGRGKGEGERKSEQLRDWDLRHYWHAFTQMAEYEPLVIERAEGVWLYDMEGNRYLDGVSSLWCNLHGHRHPRIDAAIRDQLDRIAHCTALGMSNPEGIKLAKRLADLAPGDLQHVFFSCDGSSAVEVALKIAFQYWRQCDQPPQTAKNQSRDTQSRKTKYIALGDAYHGDTLGSTSVGGIAMFHAIFGPLLFDVVHLGVPDANRRPPGVSSESACGYYLNELEQVLSEQHTEIAAVVIEPLVQGAAGMIMHPSGYLHGVRELSRQYNVLMIADEIVTAFGRTGRMFACEHEGVAPDLLCLGKGISGGYLPMSATLATDVVYEAFLGDFTEQKTFFHGHTYGGNPLAATAALASLDVLEEEKVLEQLPGKSEQLGEILARCEALSSVSSTRQIGMLAAVDLVDVGGDAKPPAANSRLGQHVCREALKRGVWLRPLGNTLIIVPPLAISHNELELLGTALVESIRGLTSRNTVI